MPERWPILERPRSNSDDRDARNKKHEEEKK